MRCPNCDHDNIPGDEQCAHCGSDLAGLDIPEADSGFAGRLMTAKIGDLPLSPAITAAPETRVADGIARLGEERHGCLLVMADGRLIGIFTERDVLARVVCAGVDPETATLAAVMTPDPVVLDRIDPPAFAVHLMVSRGFRHLPVVDVDEVLGFVSVRNLLRFVHHDVIGA